LPNNEITSFDLPNSTSTETRAKKDSGMIVGWYADGGDAYHGFMRLP